MIRISVAAVALTFTATAAAATPIYWTPAHMAKALTALSYPQGGTCRGVTTARHGTFNAFKCAMTLPATRKVTVWAKPLGLGRVCRSTVSLNTCQPAVKLAGDPNVCFGETHAGCVAVNAKTAALARWKEQTGYSNPVPTCTALSTLAYSCKMYDGKVYTVTFSKGASAWTTTVTP